MGSVNASGAGLYIKLLSNSLCTGEQAGSVLSHKSHSEEAAGHEDGIREAGSGKYSTGVPQSIGEAPTYFRSSLL